VGCSAGLDWAVRRIPEEVDLSVAAAPQADWLVDAQMHNDPDCKRPGETERRPGETGLAVSGISARDATRVAAAPISEGLEILSAAGDGRQSVLD
jgi:hypothetical protein